MRLRSSTSYGSVSVSSESNYEKNKTASSPVPPGSLQRQWDVLESFMQEKKTLPSWFVESYVSGLNEETRTQWFTTLFCMCFTKGFARDYEKRYRRLVRLCISSKTIVHLEEIARCIRDLENTEFDEVVQRFKRFRICFIDVNDNDSVEVYHHYTSEFIDERRSEFNGTVYYLMLHLYQKIPFPDSQVEYFLRNINIYNNHMLDYNPEWYPVVIPEYLYQLLETNPLQVYRFFRQYREMDILVELKTLEEKEVITDDYFFDIYFHRLLYGFSIIFDDTASIFYMLLNQNYKPIIEIFKQFDVVSLFYRSSSPIEIKYQLCYKMIPIFIQTIKEVKSKPICRYTPYFNKYLQYTGQFNRNLAQDIKSLDTLEEMINDLIIADLTHHLEKLIRLREDIQKELFPQVSKITSDLFSERQLSRIINAYL